VLKRVSAMVRKSPTQQNQCVRVFFVPQILLCCHTGNHPQGDFAIFGYRPAMEVKFIKILLYSGYLLEPMCRNMSIKIFSFRFLIVFLTMGYSIEYFFWKYYYKSPNGESFCHRKKNKKCWPELQKKKECLAWTPLGAGVGLVVGPTDQGRSGFVSS